MRYTLENQKTITIPDEEIRNLMVKLELSEKEAVETWLDDNGYELNEEQEQLDAKAKKAGVNLYVLGENSDNKPKKPRTVKVSDEKTALFSDIYAFLAEKYAGDVEIVIQNKKLLVKCANNKEITVDLIEKRQKKA